MGQERVRWADCGENSIFCGANFGGSRLEVTIRGLQNDYGIHMASESRVVYLILHHSFVSVDTHVSTSNIDSSQWICFRGSIARILAEWKVSTPQDSPYYLVLPHGVFLLPLQTRLPHRHVRGQPGLSLLALFGKENEMNRPKRQLYERIDGASC